VIPCKEEITSEHKELNKNLRGVKGEEGAHVKKWRGGMSFDREVYSPIRGEEPT